MRVRVSCLVHIQLDCLAVHLDDESLVAVLLFEGVLG